MSSRQECVEMNPLGCPRKDPKESVVVLRRENAEVPNGREQTRPEITPQTCNTMEALLQATLPALNITIQVEDPSLQGHLFGTYSD